jgi:hypothetical protein
MSILPAAAFSEYQSTSPFVWVTASSSLSMSAS